MPQMFFNLGHNQDLTACTCSHHIVAYLFPADGHRISLDCAFLIPVFRIGGGLLLLLFQAVEIC